MKSVGVLLIYVWFAAVSATRRLSPDSGSTGSYTGVPSVTSQSPGSASTTLSPSSTTPSMSGSAPLTSTASRNVTTSITPTTATTTGAPSKTPTVFVCPYKYCRDTQFNPPSTTTCIYPDPIVLMDCWEKYCDKVQVGSYCLVWEPPSGRKCSGTNKPCYCSEYEAVQGRFVLPSDVPTGWEVAPDCDYNGSPDEYPGYRHGDNGQTTTTPVTSSATGLVNGGLAVFGSILAAQVL